MHIDIFFNALKEPFRIMFLYILYTSCTADITSRSMTTTILVPEAIGQRYARMTSYWSLSSPWSSLLWHIGYQEPGVLRMWLLARCLVWISEIG